MVTLFKVHLTLVCPQYGHGDQPEDVGEDELLVDGEAEPGVVAEEAGGVGLALASRCGGVALGGEEEGGDADDGRQAGHDVGLLVGPAKRVECKEGIADTQ